MRERLIIKREGAERLLVIDVVPKLMPWNILEISTAFLVIALGISVRIGLFMQFRSLWLDEAMLSNNIVNRGFWGLTRPLDDGQGAPIGFLFVERLLWIIRHQDWALRIVPLVAGAGSLVLLLFLVKRFLSAKASILVLCLASVSIPWIYYSSEVKQYSTDMAVALLLLNLGARVIEHLSISRAAALGLFGAAAVWFSHPAIFILASIALALVTRFSQKPIGKSEIRLLLATVGICFGSFFVEYWVSLRMLSHSSGLRQYWESGYIPYRLHAINWFFRAIVSAFRAPGGFLAANLAALSAALGACWLMRETALRPLVVMLLSPLAIAVAAAGLHIYPFEGRLILYLVPLGLLFISAGVTWMWRLGSMEGRVGACVCFLLLFGYSIRDIPSLFNRSRDGAAYMCSTLSIPPIEDMRPMVARIAAERKESDKIWLYPLAMPAYQFYARQTVLADIPVNIMEWKDVSHYPSVPVVDGAARLWVLFVHTSKDLDQVSEEVWWLEKVRLAGIRCQTFRSQGCLLVLLDRPLVAESR